MPQPTKTDVHVNRPLTSISIAYLQNQNEFIASRVFPNIPVQNQSDIYFTFPKGEWFRTDAKPRAPGTESAGSGYSVASDSYLCEVQALHKDIPDQVRANTDSPLAPDSEATEFVSRGMLLRREKDFMANYFTTGIWTGSTTGSDITPSTLWSAADSSPIADIRAQMGAVKKATGFRPNKLTLAEDVWDILQDNADFLDRISIAQRKVVSRELLAAVLQLDEVLVAGAIENTAAEGATAVMAWLGTKDALLTYSPLRPSTMLPSAGYTFSWNGYLGAGADGVRMLRFRMPQLRADRVEGEMAYDQKLVAADLGVFFNNAIA